AWDSRSRKARSRAQAPTPRSNATSKPIPATASSQRAAQAGKRRHGAREVEGRFWEGMSCVAEFRTFYCTHVRNSATPRPSGPGTDPRILEKILSYQCIGKNTHVHEKIGTGIALAVSSGPGGRCRLSLRKTPEKTSRTRPVRHLSGDTDHARHPDPRRPRAQAPVLPDPLRPGTVRHRHRHPARALRAQPGRIHE